MCGFIGVLAPRGRDVIGEIHDGLVSIQHRGQDAAGACTYNGRFHIKRGMGLVREVFRDDNIARLRGNLGIGHVRYPTVGGGSVDDTQPFMVKQPFGISMAHNGNLTNFGELKRELTERDHYMVDSNCDVEAILQVFSHALAQTGVARPTEDAVFRAVDAVFERCKGAYSVVGMISGFGLFAFRDPYGIKPIIMGERTESDGKKSFCVASESVLLDLLDYHHTSSLKAGEAIVVRNDGTLTRRQIRHQPHHPCLFEWVYFARPDSFLDKVSVYKSRLRMGEHLADAWKKTGIHVDVVMPVPESARDAALALAQRLGAKYREGLVKNRYIGRTFIMPGNRLRRKSIRHKLNAIQLEFKDKDVLLVDDSIVRGNTSRELVQMAREAGARKVYFASCSPPLKHPCVYGIDMSTKNEFIARGRSSEEIAKEIGADFVLYQDLADLETSVREGNPDIAQFCTACFTGKYPTNDVTEDVLSAIEGERMLAHSKDG
ncbi:MAG TPA: amidophosphoribosyltransferase [Planctomycetota bacterium]|jgi:amidophosphoribosyltransferase|nr:amidophosphoribosyltransferase [Planctomycetota bacterium]